MKEVEERERERERENQRGPEREKETSACIPVAVHSCTLLPDLNHVTVTLKAICFCW